MNRNKLILLTAVLLLLAGGGWFLHDSGFFQAVRSLEALRAYIAGFAPYSHLLFFLVQFLSVVFAPIPSNIVAAAGGVLFGTLPGFLITFTAVASASLVTFSLARVLGREFAGRIVSKKLSEKYQGVLRTKAPVFLTLAFLFPFFPDDIPLLPQLRPDRPAGPALGTALCQRPGGLHSGAVPLGDGPHRSGGTGPVPAGDEIRQSGGRNRPPPFKGAEIGGY